MSKKFEAEVSQILEELKSVLISKNKKYGNSALDPKRIFSKADAVEQIKVRIDDKLSRMAMGTNDNEDTVMDLMGYLVLLRIAEGNEYSKKYEASFEITLTPDTKIEMKKMQDAFNRPIWEDEAERIIKALNVEHPIYRYISYDNNNDIHTIRNVYSGEELTFDCYGSFSQWLSSSAKNPDDLTSAFPYLDGHQDGET